MQPITISESVSNVDNAISNISVHKLENFLHEQCKQLITEYVLNNQSFVDGMRPFLHSYLEFNNIKKDYLFTKTRDGGKTELKNSLDAVQPNFRNTGQFKGGECLHSRLKSCNTSGLSAKCYKIISIITDCNGCPYLCFIH